MHPASYAKNPLVLAISLVTGSSISLHSASVHAQDDAAAIEEIIVTAGRREQSVQDIPINIAAVSDTAIENLRLTGIAEISRYVPGLSVLDRGPRDEVSDVFVRGLNTSQLGPGFSSDTVAVYLGDIPLNIDLKPVDLQRVEVLIGPQGTLYGQGTMGGAIRYIPKETDLAVFSGELRGDMNATEQSSGLGGGAGLTLNVPLMTDLLGFRVNVDYLEDPGFIDYPFVVRESGVSNPEPDFDNPDDVDENLRKVQDANGEETVSARLNLRFTPTSWLDANLWYYYQDTEAEGRQISNQVAFNTGRYESAARYEEPNNYTNELISLDMDIDLGFAEATIVYGNSDYDERGQRDQTDLLLGFEYDYELFPSFSSFTREQDEQDSETYEARLVSQHEGPLQWVLGYFDSEFRQDAISQEFTPGFDEFALEFLGAEGGLRPDSLEYIQLTDVREEETALYGEVSYDIVDSLTVTAGFRLYEFSVDSSGGFGTPLADTVYGGAPPDFIEVGIGENNGDDEGELFKFNVSWDIDDDNMVYATYSEGYRNGGVNAVPACTADQLNDPDNDQNLCAKADEVFIDPDTIDNYEIGYKGLLLDSKLALNAAVYVIDWTNLQVDTVTDFGNLPITGNGSAAESKGLELQSSLYLNDNWTLALTYAYTNAELTEDAPGLVAEFDALAGARLPGHAEHQGSFNITYSREIFGDIDMDINYGVVYSGDVYNVVGGDKDPLIFIERDDDGMEISRSPADRGGEAIPSYDVHHLSATFSKDSWRLQAYIDNLWDEYYILGTRNTRRDDREFGAILEDEQNGPGAQFGLFTLRAFGYYVGRPRTAGLRLAYEF